MLPNIPGFLGTIQVMEVGAFWMKLYSYAWFVGFAISFVVYVAWMLVFVRPTPAYASSYSASQG